MKPKQNKNIYFKTTLRTFLKFTKPVVGYISSVSAYVASILLSIWLSLFIGTLTGPEPAAAERINSLRNLLAYFSFILFALFLLIKFDKKIPGTQGNLFDLSTKAIMALFVLIFGSVAFSLIFIIFIDINIWMANFLQKIVNKSQSETIELAAVRTLSQHANYYIYLVVSLPLFFSVSHLLFSIFFFYQSRIKGRVFHSTSKHIYICTVFIPVAMILFLHTAPLHISSAFSIYLFVASSLFSFGIYTGWQADKDAGKFV